VEANGKQNKPIQGHESKRGTTGEVEEERKRGREGEIMTKVQHMYVWKYHDEISYYIEI
jgi:hypothetical protein